MTGQTAPQFSIRQATGQDGPYVGTFIHQFVLDQKLLPRTEDELDELLEFGYVAESEGQIIGFGSLEIYSKKLAEIRSLAVVPNWQGKGVGKRLVAACVDRAREHGILEVMAVTSAEHFFRSCGFDFTLPGEKKALFIQTRDL